VPLRLCSASSALPYSRIPWPFPHPFYHSFSFSYYRTCSLTIECVLLQYLPSSVLSLVLFLAPTRSLALPRALLPGTRSFSCARYSSNPLSLHLPTPLTLSLPTSLLLEPSLSPPPYSFNPLSLSAPLFYLSLSHPIPNAPHSHRRSTRGWNWRTSRSDARRSHMSHHLTHMSHHHTHMSPGKVCGAGTGAQVTATQGARPHLSGL